MAATAAAAVGSSFSSSIHTFKCIRSKHCPSDVPLLRISSTRMLASTSLSSRIEQLSLSAISSKWRLLRISAAVAQEEVAVTAELDAGTLVEDHQEDKGGEEVLLDGEAESAVNTKLYFGNLPYSVDSAQLAGIIQDFRSPELIEVLYDRDSGRSRGFAFVTMSSIEDCNLVIQNLDGKEYMGRTLRVNFSDKPKPKDPLYPETEHKLFVGNLSWSVTSESLTQAFQEYGNVVGARVLYDGETGRSRGYGFVCYSTKSEMETAIESLNGVELEGRAMRVSLAQGKRS
ncbi:28 kDa ribonucleoprotein, chloroplastic-like [Juglans microcarpa x Juglans regia]|uniref:28 kDa ribonucleoprotein, chloroplastic-like n=1 Tax=Juglans microcarpa x Juglans regia TaxID=2249226 RepID=UPI001B7EF1B2|nr:28 kDa ribonucleoprotein, chloroplastic-like [Juglans microcarpa x Juglans regia]